MYLKIFYYKLLKWRILIKKKLKYLDDNDDGIILQRTKYILVVHRLLVIILGDITFYFAEIQPAAKSGHCSQRRSAAIKRAGGIARTWRKELMKHGGYHTQDGRH